LATGLDLADVQYRFHSWQEGLRIGHGSPGVLAAGLPAIPWAVEGLIRLIRSSRCRVPGARPAPPGGSVAREPVHRVDHQGIAHIDGLLTVEWSVPSFVEPRGWGI